MFCQCKKSYLNSIIKITKGGFFMRYTEIAIAKPFEGAPKINLAEAFGASPNKPIILKIPVTGKRPMKYNVLNLPKGLDLADGIIRGQVELEGDYKVTLIVENELGKAEKELVLEIKENNLLLSPLLGFTTWNAFQSAVTQELAETSAKIIIESGIAEYGYSYINIDSGWQKEYGGKYDAIMPNEKFPDMGAFCDLVHNLGLKCGIYSTPMLTAWGCPEEFESVPGCTQGEADILFADANGGVGVVRKEKNNALQWAEWGFDYLKYDWCPCDPYNADLMKKALLSTNRDFAFCVTTWASHHYHKYWETHCNHYRCNEDSVGTWDNLLSIYNSRNRFVKHIKRGHYFDMDMLDVGNGVHRGFNEDEQLVAYSMRAFFSSPIQISSDLRKLTEFELSMYCNDEILEIHQDNGYSIAEPYLILEENNRLAHIFKKRLADGGVAFAFFNLGDTTENLIVNLDETAKIRDVWAKKDISESNVIEAELKPHTVRIFKAL